MLARESQNLLPALEMAEAVYGGSARQLPDVGRDRVAQRAAHLAAGVRFALAEPEAMRHLHSVTGHLLDAAGLDSLLPRVLDGALSLTGADFATLHLRDPAGGSLWLVTQSGFGPEFLDCFAVVDEGDSNPACGRAAQACAQAVIADVNADQGFAPYRSVAAAAGFRAVQSTPLADFEGRLIGVASMYFARPYLPAARDLRIMELYGDAAGEAIGRRLGVPAGQGTGDPAGPAVLTALLDPGDGQVADPAIVLGPGYGRDGGSGRRPALLEDVMSQFAGQVVGRLFSVGLSLDSALSMIGSCPAADRVAAATDETDHLIRDIRTIMFSLAADAPGQPAQHPRPQRGAQPRRTQDLLDWVSASVFDIGMALEAAADPPPGSTTGPHLTEALRRLDEMARVIRDHLFAELAQPALAGLPAPHGRDRPARTADPAALRQRMAQAARSLQVTATEAAALLEQQPELIGQPQRMDYPTEVKRWRSFADQAARIARRWEQVP